MIPHNLNLTDAACGEQPDGASVVKHDLTNLLIAVEMQCASQWIVVSTSKIKLAAHRS